MGPELLHPQRFGLSKSRLTKESDCYALGMVVYETLSGKTPFAGVPFPTLILKVLDGDRPERPRGARGAWLGDDIWEMLDLCWKAQPYERPSLGTILQCLRGAPRPSMPSSYIIDNDAETNTGGQPDATNGSAVNHSSMFPPFGLTSHTHIPSSSRRTRFINQTPPDAVQYAPALL